MNTGPASGFHARARWGAGSEMPSGLTILLATSEAVCLPFRRLELQQDIRISKAANLHGNLSRPRIAQCPCDRFNPLPDEVIHAA